MTTFQTPTQPPTQVLKHSRQSKQQILTPNTHTKQTSPHSEASSANTIRSKAKTLAATVALNRLAFGPDFLSMHHFESYGYEAWLGEQLSPMDALDTRCHAQMAAFTLPIKYAEHKDGLWPAVDEIRPFTWLDASSEQLMNITPPGKPVSGEEQWRPAREVMCATLIRAVYSKWQLREVLTGFWHQHFNVNVGVGGPTLLTFPVYDRDVIRANVFGNFRQMLEAVAKSAAMLNYLNNRSSRAGAPNENYARELFELHTMGSPAYLNTLYNQWRKVPGALNNKPVGYIDQDVYEAARAFTGWSIADGTAIGNGKSLARTGEFAYVDAWHDQYQKRILATEIDPYQGPMKDGLRALDLTAYHPATALYLSHKLCTRLLSDNPPESLVKSTAQVWMAHQEHPKQIAKVVEHIALSKEFTNSQSTKMKRPMELMASYVRSLQISDQASSNVFPFKPTMGLVNHLSACGQPLFGWNTPAGLPDVNARWLGANALWQRWNLIAGLTDNWWGCGNLDAFAAFAAFGLSHLGNHLEKPTTAQWAQVCTTQMLATEKNAAQLNQNPSAQLSTPLTEQLIKASGQKPEAPLTNPAIAKRMLAWTAMAPEFQVR